MRKNMARRRCGTKNLISESLEARRMLAFDFAGLANNVNGYVGTLDSALQLVGNTANDLPFASRSVNEINEITQTFSRFRSQLANSIQSLSNSLTDANLVRDAIFGALSNLPSVGNILGNRDANPAINRDDVTVSNFNAAAGTLEVSINLAKSFTLLASQDVLGIGSIPLKVTGPTGNWLGIDLSYRDLTFGVNAGGFYVNTSTADELKFTLRGNMPASVQLLLGYVNLSATDTHAGDDLSLDLIADVSSMGATGLINNPRLIGNANVRLRLEAASDLRYLPKIRGDLAFDWSFLNVNPSASHASFGTPMLSFTNVQVNLRGLLDSVLGDVGRKLGEFLQPISPVLEFLNTPIPGFSDLSNFALGRPFRVVDLAGIAFPSTVSDVVTSLNTVLSWTDQIAQLAGDPATSDKWINVGTLNASGAPGANLLGTSAASLGSLTNVNWSSLRELSTDIPLAATLNDLVTQIGNSPVGQQLVNVVQRFTPIGTGAPDGFYASFPIVENPKQTVFKLLVGQDADLVRFTGRLMTTLDRADAIYFPIISPLQARFAYNFNPDIQFTLGIDTRGVRDFARSVINNASNAYLLFNSVYIDQSQTFANLSARIEGGVGLGFGPIADISVNGSLTANIAIHLSSNTGQTKLRPFAGDIDPARLLDLSGELKLGVDVVATAFTAEVFRLNFAETSLMKFDVSLGTATAQPFSELVADPELLEPATLDAGVLRLNVGPRTANRLTFLAIPDESYHLSRTGNRYLVSAFGQTREYVGVTSIVGDFGAGNDSILIDDNIAVPVSILGGDGNDLLDVRSRGDATVAGQAGDDHLHVYPQVGKQIQVYGDAGIDDITITPVDRRTFALPTADTTLVASGGADRDFVWFDAPLRFTQFAQVDLGSGDDRLLIAGGASADTNPAEQFTVSGSSGNDLLTLDDSARTTATSTSLFSNGSVFRSAYPKVIFVPDNSFESELFTLGSGDDSVNGAGGSYTLRQQIRGGPGNDSVTSSFGEVRFYGDAGDDSMSITGTANDSAFARAFIGGAGHDTLVLDDSNRNATDFSARNWLLNRPADDETTSEYAQIIKPNELNGMQWDGTEQTDITTSNLDDTINIADGPSGTSATFGFSAQNSIVFHTRGGADTMNVTTRNPIAVTFDAGAGTDTVRLNHSAAPAGTPWNYGVSGQLLDSSYSTGFQFAFGPRVGLLDVQSITTDGNDADNVITISSIDPGQIVAVNGWGGNDLINVRSRRTTDVSQQANLGDLLISGGAGTDTLGYDDSLNPNPVTLTLNPTTIPAGFGSILQNTAEKRAYESGQSGDTLIVNSDWLVRSNGGDDTIYTSGNATVLAGSGSDRLYSTFEFTGGVLDGGADYDYFEPTYDQIERGASDVTWTIDRNRIEHFANNTSAGDIDVTLTHAAIESFNFDASLAAQLYDAPLITWNISSTGVDTFLNIASNGASDQFDIFPSAQSDPAIGNSIALDGNGGLNTLSVLASTTNNVIVHMTAGLVGYSPLDTISAPGAMLTYYDIAAATLVTGTGNDRIYYAPHPLTHWTINAAGNTAAGDQLVLAIAGIASSPGNPLTPAGTVTFTGYAPLDYLEVESITSDSSAPTIQSAAWNYNAPIPSITLQFSETIAAVFPAYITSIVNTNTLQEFDPGLFTPIVGNGSSSAQLRYNGSPNHILPDGNYLITISPGFAYDAAGNYTAAASAHTFRVMAGDVDGDGVVGFTDLLTLAQNYGLSGRSFAQGNLDYDPAGLVDFNDLLILAQRYGTSLLNTPGISLAKPRPSRTLDWI